MRTNRHPTGGGELGHAHHRFVITCVAAACDIRTCHHGKQGFIKGLGVFSDTFAEVRVQVYGHIGRR